jgi:hypothetical protein
VENFLQNYPYLTFNMNFLRFFKSVLLKIRAIKKTILYNINDDAALRAASSARAELRSTALTAPFPARTFNKCEGVRAHQCLAR